jgi:hypothetical protein
MIEIVYQQRSQIVVGVRQRNFAEAIGGNGRFPVGTALGALVRVEWLCGCIMTGLLRSLTNACESAGQQAGGSVQAGATGASVRCGLP